MEFKIGSKVIHAEFGKGTIVGYVPSAWMGTAWIVLFGAELGLGTTGERAVVVSEDLLKAPPRRLGNVLGTWEATT